MGFGWIALTANNIPITEFSGSTKNFASSTKAEAFAIFTAIISSPPNSNINIYTDSQGCINTFNHFTHSSQSERRNLKLNNYLIWHAIFSIITCNNIKITFTKVKSHSKNTYNDHADQLAKEGTKLPDHITINRSLPILPNNNIIWNDEIVIDKNIRTTINNIQHNIQFSKLFNHNHTKQYKHHIKTNKISFYWTQKWFAHNPLTSTTSIQTSIFSGHKLKYFSKNMPTTDILHHNFPNLITSQLKCLRCNQTEETNDHLWQCPESQIYIYNASRMIYCNIFQLILSNSKASQNTIHNFMSKLNIFNVKISGQLLTHDHPIILLYHQLIPEDLIASFKHFKIKKKIYEPTLLQLIYSFFSYLHLNIWKDRSTLFKIWKSTHNINKTDFKNYNKIHRSSRQPTNTHTQIKQPHIKNIKTPLNDHNRPNNPQEDWIIWTSSNFIHNLPWYHCLHKDIAYSPAT